MDSWSIQKAARTIARDTGSPMKYSAARKYFHDHKAEIQDIKNNSKIWGDAGELYFAALLRREIERVFAEKGKTLDGFRPGVLPIYLSVAAEERRDGGPDVEVLVFPLASGEEERRSVCQVNVKFSFVDDQSFKVVPEGLHDHPFLFVINKSTLSQRLLKLEKGKTLVTVGTGGVGSEVEEWCIDRLVEWIIEQV